jgi:hypothetical protein
MKKIVLAICLFSAVAGSSQNKVGIGTNNPQRMLSVLGGLNVDQGNTGDGTSLTNGLSFGFTGNTGIASDRSSLSFITNGVKQMQIDNGGSVGLGTSPNIAKLQIAHSGNVYGYDFSNDGHAIMISSTNTGGSKQELIMGSDATNHVSYILADSTFMYPTGSVLVLQGRGGRLSVGNILKPTHKFEVDGTARLTKNLLVQGDKGIIRSQDTSQQKIITTNVLMNYSSTPIATNSTVAKNIIWDEPFNTIPVAYVGNFTGGGGWAEVVVSIANVTTTGCSVYIYNPRPAAYSPNFYVNIVAIGGQ